MCTAVRNGSLGTVTGALVGALMVLLHVPVTAHLLATGVVIAVAVPFGLRGYLPDHVETEADGSPAPTRSALAAWKEPRTLLIGLFVLSFAFAEGAGNDWISVAVIDDYRAPEALGTLAFAVFLASMTTGRWFGPPLLDRFGRVAMVRATALVAVVGVLLFVFGGATPVAYGGAVLWGLGVSLGFPVGMSAGADDPRYAASRVSVIASVGYCAFLGGPPLLGLLGNHFTVLKALTAVAVLLGVSAMIAASVRPPADVAARGTPEAAQPTASGLVTPPASGPPAPRTRRPLEVGAVAHAEPRHGGGITSTAHVCTTSRPAEDPGLIAASPRNV